jgi:hypothetical protein
LIIVITSYLLYTLYEADWQIRQTGNFYDSLGIGPDATEREVRSRFRRVAAAHHPDKRPAGSADDGGAAFIRLKMAADTLANEAARFAYERFGSEMVQWKHCTTKFDYISAGLRTVILPYYAGAAFLMYVMGLLGFLGFARYWRWLVLFALLAFELLSISRPNPPEFISRVINPAFALFGRSPYLQFQVVSLARRLCVTLYIGFSQLGPLLVPARNRSGGPGASDEAALKDSLNRLSLLTGELDRNASSLLELEFTPLRGEDRKTIDGIKEKVREWLVQNTIRNDPLVKDAIGGHVKRRSDAPPGARGTR